ncbi:MAG: aldo/keto reductase family oxidoreductase, partial [Firmicutes bacterium]|nr:aldo/keto reductase family oxidoreductase [Bacillota bacterium]
PAKMQVISGTTSEARLKEIAQADTIELSREEWYQLYMSAGHPLP